MKCFNHLSYHLAFWLFFNVQSSDHSPHLPSRQSPQSWVLQGITTSPQGCKMIQDFLSQYSANFGAVLVWLLACQMLPNSILFRYGNLLFSWEKDKSMPLWSLVHMLCHQHLVLAPQRDFFVLNLQIRQIFTRSSFDHGIPASSTRCTALSPATPISPNAISHLQNTQRQKSMNLCPCPKISEISKSPKDSAPPPLWPRMPWARKYFRCMPLQRGKQATNQGYLCRFKIFIWFCNKGKWDSKQSLTRDEEARKHIAHTCTYHQMAFLKY